MLQSRPGLRLVLLLLLLAASRGSFAQDVARAAEDGAAKPAASGDDAGAPQAGPDRATRLAWIADRLRAAMDESKAPGMSVAVVQDDEVVLLEAFGSRDLERQLPATPDTVFAIGSATKAFTATLVGWLMDRARMRWDDRVFKRVPSFRLKEPGATGTATIADLLSQRTGLMRGVLTWWSGTATPAQILEACTRAEPTAPMGTRWQENDNMYLAAGLAAASAGDDVWEALIREKLLQPLGMRSTTTDRAEASPDVRLARGYERDASGALREAFDRNPWNVAPALAIRSNATDMAVWLRFLLGRGRLGDERHVSQERMEEAWRPLVPVPSAAVGGRVGVSSGMGWFVDQWRGRRRVFAPGAIDGFSALVSILPEENVGVAVLCNESSSALPMAVEEAVWHGLLDETLADTEADPVPAPVEGLAGRYWFQPIKDWVTVAVDDGAATVEIPGQPRQRLLPPDERGRWRFAATDMVEVAFDRDAAGTVEQMRLYQAGLEFELLREGVTRPAEVDAEEVATLLGRYQDDALGTAVEIRIDRGRLALDVPGQMLFELHPPDANGWWVFRVSRSMAVAFARDEQGAVTGLRLMQRGQEKVLPRIGGPDAPAASESLAALLARHRAAHGVAALPSRGAVRVVGTIDFLNQGIAGTCTMLADGQSRLRRDIDLGPFGRSRLALLGDVCQTQSSFEPTRSCSTTDAIVQRLANPLFPPTLFDDPHATMVVVGRSEDDGVRLVGVAVESGASASGPGASSLIWLEEATGLCRRIEAPTANDWGGPRRQSIELGDYREVAGMRIPFRVVTDDPALGRSVLAIDDARVDPEAGEAAFALTAPE